MNASIFPAQASATPVSIPFSTTSTQSMIISSSTIGQTTIRFAPTSAAKLKLPVRMDIGTYQERQRKQRQLALIDEGYGLLASEEDSTDWFKELAQERLQEDERFTSWFNK